MSKKRTGKYRPQLAATRHKWLITDIINTLSDLLSIQEQITEAIDPGMRVTPLALLALRQSPLIADALQKARDAKELIDNAPTSGEMPLVDQIEDLQAQIDELRVRINLIANDRLDELIGK